MDNLSHLTPSSSQDSIHWNPQQQQQEQPETYHDKIPHLSHSTDHVPTENKSIKSRFFSWIAGMDVKTTLASAGSIILGISLVILGIVKNYQSHFPHPQFTPFIPVAQSEEPPAVVPQPVMIKMQPQPTESPVIPVAQPIVVAATPATAAETQTEIPQQTPSVFDALNGQEVKRVVNHMTRERAALRKKVRLPTTALRENVEKIAPKPTVQTEAPVAEATVSPTTTVNSRTNPNIGSRIAHLQQQGGGIQFQLPGTAPNFRKPTQTQQDQSSQIDGA